MKKSTCVAMLLAFLMGMGCDSVKKEEDSIQQQFVKEAAIAALKKADVNQGEYNQSDLTQFEMLHILENEFARAIENAFGRFEFVKKMKVKILAGKFTAREHFKVNANNGAKDKILVFENEELTDWLISRVETQDNDEEIGIRLYELKRKTFDREIISQLGGEGIIGTSLSVMVGLLPALEKNVTYIFYIKDAYGTVHSMNVSKNDLGCSVNPGSTGGYTEWNAGVQIVSLNYRGLGN